jgi:hypothetical protein
MQLFLIFSNDLIKIFVCSVLGDYIDTCILLSTSRFSCKSPTSNLMETRDRFDLKPDTCIDQASNPDPRGSKTSGLTTKAAELVSVVSGNNEPT